MPSNLPRVLQDMRQGLTPLDAEVFAEAAQVIAKMSRLELARYMADPARFPQLDTGIEMVNTRLSVVARETTMQHSEEASVLPEHDPDGRAGKKARLTQEEKDALDITNKCLRAVDETMGEERRAASNNLQKAQLALTAAQHEEQAAAANPSIGTKAQLAAKNAAIVAKNGVKNALAADIDAQAKYAGAMRSLMPAAKDGGIDLLGVGKEEAKPPPI